MPINVSLCCKSSKRARIGTRGTGDKDTSPNVAIRCSGRGSSNANTNKKRNSTVTAKSNTTEKKWNGLGNYYSHNHTSSTHYFNYYNHHHNTNSNHVNLTIAGNEGIRDKSTRSGSGSDGGKVRSPTNIVESSAHSWLPLPFEFPQTQSCLESKPVSLQVVGDDNPDRSNLPHAVPTERGHHSASASATPLAATGHPVPAAVLVPDPIADPIPSASSSASASSSIKYQPAPGLPTSPVWYDSRASMDPVYGGGGDISPVDSVLTEPPPSGTNTCPYTSPYSQHTVPVPTHHQSQQDGRSWSQYSCLPYLGSGHLMTGASISSQRLYPAQNPHLDSFSTQSQAQPLPHHHSFSPNTSDGGSPDVATIATTASTSSTVPDFRNPLVSFDVPQQQYPPSFDFVGCNSPGSLDYPFQFPAVTTAAGVDYPTIGPIIPHIDSYQRNSWQPHHQPPPPPQGHQPHHTFTARTMDDPSVLVNWTHGTPMTHEVVNDSDSQALVDPAEPYIMVNDLSDGTCHDEGDFSPAEGDESQAKKPKKQRGALEPEKRAQTSATRKMKACVRCRIQKIRCIADPNHPDMCQTCRNVHMESKKVIHRLPCVRYKLAEMTMFRSNGLALTARWSETQCKDLQRESWAPGDDIRDVRVSLGFFDTHHLVFRVRRFNPDPVKWKDVTARTWRDRNGILHRTEIAAYALQDVNSTANWYRAYSKSFSHNALDQFCRKNSPTGGKHAHHIVLETYLAAKELASHARHDFDSSKDKEPNKPYPNPANFMRRYVWLWFAIRNTIGSAFLVGKEKLDMVPEPHPDYPYKDIATRTSLISIPRMVSEQFNNISYERVLLPMRKKLLETLESMMASKCPAHFWAIYLSVFMMLHEVSAMSKDRRRHAQHNQPELRYTLPDFVEELQEGANILLYHWHYYRRGFHPLTTNIQKSGKKDPWVELNHMQLDLLRRTAETYEELDRTGASLHLQPEDDLYFVKQMLDENWQHSDTFRATNNHS